MISVDNGLQRMCQKNGVPNGGGGGPHFFIIID